MDAQQIEIHIALTAVYAFFYVTFFVIFIWRRKKEPIASRCWELALLQTFFANLDNIFNIPACIPSCYLIVLRATANGPLLTYPYLIRAFVLFYNSEAQNSKCDYIQASDEVSLHSLESEEEKDKYFSMNRKTWRRRIINFVHKRKYLISLKAQMLAVLILFLIELIIATTLYYVDTFPQDLNCYPDHEIDVNVLSAVVMLLSIIFFAYLTWHSKDIYLFKTELIFLIFGAAPFFFLYAVADILNWGGAINNFLWYDIFEILCLFGTLGIPAVGSFLYSLRIRRGMQITNLDDADFVASSASDPSELEIELSSNPIPKQQADLKALFIQCMRNEKLSKELEAFAAKSFCVENILFYRAYLVYKEKPESHLKNEAKNIVSKFIQLGSPCEINIDESVRELILERFNIDQITIDLFNDAEIEISRMILHAIFPLWLAGRS